MAGSRDREETAPSSAWPFGGTESARHVRNHDWNATPLGAMHDWPPELKTAVALVLNNGLPAALALAPGFFTIANAQFSALLERSVAPPGIPLQDLWGSAWHTVSAVIEQAMLGQPAHIEDISLQLDRSGKPREAHVTLSVTPFARLDGTIGGVMVTAVETTDRVRATNELKRNEEQLRLSLEATSDGLWDWNVATGELYLSPANYTMLGYEPGGYPATFDSWLERLHPEDLERTVRLNMDCVEGRTDRLRVEYRMRARNGEWRWILGRGRPVAVAGDGKPLRLIGTHVDITERKRTEERLREAEARAELALEASGDSLWDWDLKADRILRNAAWGRLRGYSPGEFGDDPAQRTDGIHPDDRQRVAAALSDHLNGKQPAYRAEYRVRAKDGSYRWILDRGRVMRRSPSGEALRIIGFETDITSQKATEEALAKSESRYRALFEETLDGLFLADTTGRYLDANPAGTRMLGYALDEIRQLSISDVIDPHEIARLPEHIAKLKDGKVLGSEWRFLRKDGTGFIGEVVSHILPDGRLLGILRDTTERKRAEEQRALLLAEVNHRAKNLLAVVQSMARMAASVATPDEFYQSFIRRLASLATSHDLLVRSEWLGAAIGDLVEHQLSHFSALARARIRLDGPPLKLNSAAAQLIGMAFHELGTNAAKYGALSNERGVVTLSWRRLREAGNDDDTLVVQWQEQGGPVISQPSRRGFGHAVLVDAPEHQLDAAVSLTYAQTGLIWELRTPAAKALSTAGTTTYAQGR